MVAIFLLEAWKISKNPSIKSVLHTSAHKGECCNFSFNTTLRRANNNCNCRQTRSIIRVSFDGSSFVSSLCIHNSLVNNPRMASYLPNSAVCFWLETTERRNILSCWLIKSWNTSVGLNSHNFKSAPGQY